METGPKGLGPARADAHYTARAIKGTALLEETRALLRAWKPGETTKEFRRRVDEEGLLGKATASRRDDLVRRVFEPRFLVEGDEPASSLRRLLVTRGDGPWFADLCLLYAARTDVVVREAVTVFLAAARARAVSSVNTPDFMRFLAEQQDRGRTPRPWSLTVRESVARHTLHQLSDCGVLSAPRKGARLILRYTPHAIAIVWLACDLHRRGISDAALVRHADWAVYQLTEADVRDALDRLSELGLWVYQGAGSVVRIAWTWSDWSTVLSTLEGSAVDGHA